MSHCTPSPYLLLELVSTGLGGLGPNAIGVLVGPAKRDVGTAIGDEHTHDATHVPLEGGREAGRSFNDMVRILAV